VKLRFPQGTSTIYHPTTAVKSAVANKNTSKNCESGFCQTKMKHLPTVLAVVQQQNIKLNKLLLAANSEEWNDDELDLYETIFLQKSKCHEVCGCWYVLLNCIKNTIKECGLY